MPMPFHISGHRGARGLWPENTLEGFAATFALGVQSVELDVAITADGIPVLMHDPALNPDIVRGPDGRWLEGPAPLIRDLPRAALHRYDVGRLRPGGRYGAPYIAGQAPRDGARIPALVDVLALARPTGVIVDIEVKTMPDHPEWTVAPERMVDAVLEVVAAIGMERRVALRSFDWRALAHAQRVAPAIPRGYITSPDVQEPLELWWGGADPASHGGSIPAIIAALSPSPGTLWAPGFRRLTAAQLEDAHALGLRVMPWTVNEPEDMVRLIAMGVREMCTDYPDRLQAVLAGQVPA
jgi:glycerophosphoryl diester phosphodiesterase